MPETLLFPKKFPELKTARLSLRMVYDSDAALVFRLYSDARVMQFRGEAVFREKTQAEQLIFQWRKRFALENGMRWAIVLRATEKMIGSIGFKQIQQQHLRADLGYELDPDWWNRGIMTEAIKAVSDFGLNEMQLHSIEANISPDHLASRRVLEKIGFKLEAHYRENYFYEGWWDSAIWSLRKK